MRISRIAHACLVAIIATACGDSMAPPKSLEIPDSSELLPNLQRNNTTPTVVTLTSRMAPAECLADSAADGADGTPLVLATCTGGEQRQLFTLGDKAIKAFTGKCVDVSG